MKQISAAQLKDGLAYLLNQWGKDYELGVENDKTDNPIRWDCSELAQSGYNLKWSTPLPDGARYQYDWCKDNGKQIYYPLSEVLPGDLIFLWEKDGKTIGHVCIVYGKMEPHGGPLLIEARGRPWGKVILTPLDIFVNQFKDRVAGIYRVFETKS